MSPNGQRVTHYILRYGNATATIINVHWSPYNNVPHPVARVGYIDANVVLKPTTTTAAAAAAAAGDDVNFLTEFVQPFEPVKPPRGMILPTIDVDLCVTLLSPKVPPFAYNIARASVMYLREQDLHPGHVDMMSVEKMNEDNRVLPERCCNPELEWMFENRRCEDSSSMSDDDDENNEEELEVSEVDDSDSESSSSMSDDEDNDDDENDSEESEIGVEDEEEEEDGDTSGEESS